MRHRGVERAASRYACLLFLPVPSGALIWAVLRVWQAWRPRLQARPGGLPLGRWSVQGILLAGVPAWHPPHCQAAGTMGSASSSHAFEGHT